MEISDMNNEFSKNSSRVNDAQFYFMNIIIENYLCGLIKPGKAIPCKRFIKLAQEQAGCKNEIVRNELICIKNNRYCLNANKDILRKYAYIYFVALCLNYGDQETLLLQANFFNDCAKIFLELPENLHFHPRDAKEDTGEISRPNLEEGQRFELSDDDNNEFEFRIFTCFKTEKLRENNIERLLIDIIKGMVKTNNEVTDYLANGLGDMSELNCKCTFFYSEYEDFIRQEKAKCYINADLYNNMQLLCRALLTSISKKFIDSNAAIVFSINLMPKN